MILRNYNILKNALYGSRDKIVSGSNWKPLSDPELLSTDGTQFGANCDYNWNWRCAALFSKITDKNLEWTSLETGSSSDWGYASYSGSVTYLNGFVDMVISSGASKTVEYTDYVPDGTQITTMDVLSTIRTTDDTTSLPKLTRVYKNTTSDTITINEVGVITRLSEKFYDGYSSRTCTAPKPILIILEKLETPITVAPDQIIEIAVRL